MLNGGQSKRIDATGNKYGKLEVIGYARTKIAGDGIGGGTHQSKLWLTNPIVGLALEDCIIENIKQVVSELRLFIVCDDSTFRRAVSDAVLGDEEDRG